MLLFTLFYLVFHYRIDGGSLRSFTSHWPPQHWQEYEPLLNYCRDNGVKLVACGTPLEVHHICNFVSLYVIRETQCLFTNNKIKT